ncbi:MAG: hypothetical protein KIT76_12530, partial [Pseudolabrys sp.]|nr:hypothetical protein [Pseudolabrys sp.]
RSAAAGRPPEAAKGTPGLNDCCLASINCASSPVPECPCYCGDFAGWRRRCGPSAVTIAAFLGGSGEAGQTNGSGTAQKSRESNILLRDRANAYLLIM